MEAAGDVVSWNHHRPPTLQSAPSLDIVAGSPDPIIPREFMCPLSRQMMTDPVIIASGQTYERSTITRWFAEGHKTCPKSRQIVEHTNFCPNFALKSLISDWRASNAISFPERRCHQNHDVMVAPGVTSRRSNLSSGEFSFQDGVAIGESGRKSTAGVYSEQPSSLSSFSEMGADLCGRINDLGDAFADASSACASGRTSQSSSMVADMSSFSPQSILPLDNQIWPASLSDAASSRVASQPCGSSALEGGWGELQPTIDMQAVWESINKGKKLHGAFPFMASPQNSDFCNADVGSRLIRAGGSMKMARDERSILLEDFDDKPMSSIVSRQSGSSKYSDSPSSSVRQSPVLKRSEYLRQKAAMKMADDQGKPRMIYAHRPPIFSPGGSNSVNGIRRMVPPSPDRSLCTSGGSTSSTISDSVDRESMRRSGGSGIPRGGLSGSGMKSLQRTSSCTAFDAKGVEVQRGRTFRKVVSNPPSLIMEPVPVRERKTEERGQGNALHVMTMATLVDALNFGSVDERRAAAKAVRSMIKGSVENKVQFVDEGGIESLVELLSAEDADSVEHSLSALMNLSLHGNSSAEVVKAGGIPAMVAVLQNGSPSCRANAAGALFAVSKVEDHKLMVRASGAIPILVDLLKTGTARAQKDTSLALFTLSTNIKCAKDIVKADAMSILMQKLEENSPGMEEKVTAVMSNLSRFNEGCKALLDVDAVTKFVDLLEEGSTLRVKEDAASILLQMAYRGFVSYGELLAEGVLPSLVQIAQIKQENSEAKLLLDILRKHCAQRSSHV